MADPHVISTLQGKIHDLQRLIMSYEQGLDKARQDLAIMTGAYAIFQTEGGVPIEFAEGVGVRNLFKRGDVWAICREALAGAPDGLNTRKLAVRCLEARGLDPENAVLRRAMIHDLISILRKRQKLYEVTREDGDQKSVVWKLTL